MYQYRETVGDGTGPLVFTFHGTGGSEDQFHALGERILPGATVISPRGDVSERGAARYFRRTAEGVYDMEDLARRTEAMAEFVRAARGRTGGAPVLGFGYSNGANILAAVSFRHPGLFDRIALLHPLIPWVPEPAAGLSGRSVLVTAGRRDPICPVPLTESLIDWYHAQGAAVSTLWHPGGHEIDGAEVQALTEFLRDPSPVVSAADPV